MVHLAELFERLQNAKLLINLAKTEFAKAEVMPLERNIGHRRMNLSGVKMKIIKEFPRSSLKKEEFRFLGLNGFFWKFKQKALEVGYVKRIKQANARTVQKVGQPSALKSATFQSTCLQLNKLCGVELGELRKTHSELLGEMHGSPKELVFAIFYPLLAVIGLPANLLAIVILLRGNCGLSRCITLYLTALAVADFLVILTAVVLNRISGIYFQFSFLSITPICSLRAVLNVVGLGSSAWLTVAFAFDRFVAICWQKLKIKYCTEKTAARVIGAVYVAFCFISSFLYFIYEPLYIDNHVPWFCNVKAIFYTEPAWAAYDLILRILCPCLAFTLILLFNARTVKHIIVASKARSRLRSQNGKENKNDPEMENRRKSIVLLFCVSGSFVLLWIWMLITFIYVRIASLNYSSSSNFNESNYILKEIGVMLQLMSSCINPFIYAGTQSKFRQQVKIALKYPLTLFAKFGVMNRIGKRPTQKEVAAPGHFPVHWGHSLDWQNKDWPPTKKKEATSGHGFVEHPRTVRDRRHLPVAKNFNFPSHIEAMDCRLPKRKMRCCSCSFRVAYCHTGGVVEGQLAYCVPYEVTFLNKTGVLINLVPFFCV
ncbi:uncharacterized protein LOC125449240 [Stegostoma tigrinum]|uniref:uncharacterized protein LOC125449240 n=1 Tax=Stegostoma tigrinum TaxID=3053191 RepID=UPI002870A89B|nr:uncharacterized protein LOC125449240 [Stegostoma tigrinum]